MIQSSYNKPIEPKASVKAPSSAPEKTKESKRESSAEKSEFASELESASNETSTTTATSVDREAEPKVKPVQVSAEQVIESPSNLIKLPESGADAINPKVFDPALTQGVDAIVQPKTTEAPVELTNEQVLKLAAGEVAVVEAELDQTMLKTPQIAGRSPAIDMAKAEVDPQLMSMEDFVAQKNLATKKALNNTAYGMTNKAPGQNAVVSENGLKATQTVNELGAKSGEGAANSSMNSQQFILNAQADLGTNAKVNEAQAPVKTFNMSNIKTDNPNQIMTQITDYIVQAKAAKEPTVNMRVNHEQLGMIDITVQKMNVGQDSIAINIGTHSVDGKNFFQANSKDLFSHLTSSGLNVSDLKVETPAQTAKNDFDFGSQSGRGGQSGADKQFGSEQNQKRHDSDRRQDLWNLLRDKEAA